MKKILTLIMIGIIAFFLITFFTNKKQNIKTNFTEEETKWIETLPKNKQEYFLSINDLYPLLKEPEFDVSKFEDYLNFYQNHTKLSLTTIVTLVNDNLQNENIDSFLTEENVDLDRLKRYLSYQEKNPSLTNKQIITLVNQDIDSITMEYHESIENFMKEKYFIKDNLERYIDYQTQYKTSTDKTVSYVNSNLDYDYYTHTEDANFEKGNLILVNKYYVLPNDYVPEDLVTIEEKYGKTLQMDRTSYNAFKEMADAAKKEGLTLYITSPYRSYQTQNRLYQNYCNQDGQKMADTYSARPGYSEHQTGLAADIVSGAGKPLSSFEATKEFAWMLKNSYKYGFILRYPEGKELITGYQYEPWHYRYVGVETATKINELNITYDEYYAYYVK